MCHMAPLLLPTSRSVCATWPCCCCPRAGLCVPHGPAAAAHEQVRVCHMALLLLPTSRSACATWPCCCWPRAGLCVPHGPSAAAHEQVRVCHMALLLLQGGPRWHTPAWKALTGVSWRVGWHASCGSKIPHPSASAHSALPPRPLPGHWSTCVRACVHACVHVCVHVCVISRTHANRRQSGLCTVPQGVKLVPAGTLPPAHACGRGGVLLLARAAASLCSRRAADGDHKLMQR